MLFDVLHLVNLFVNLLAHATDTPLSHCVSLLFIS